mmetsp:Transcript_11521/g.38497  ORF Transcript_11521/g.38497 Transcript_11521/m.38497 type:complete len:283 (-) Transcript_11521:212-1060(-)
MTGYVAAPRGSGQGKCTAAAATASAMELSAASPSASGTPRARRRSRASPNVRPRSRKTRATRSSPNAARMGRRTTASTASTSPQESSSSRRPIANATAASARRSGSSWCVIKLSHSRSHWSRGSTSESIERSNGQAQCLAAMASRPFPSFCESFARCCAKGESRCAMSESSAARSGAGGSEPQLTKWGAQWPRTQTTASNAHKTSAPKTLTKGKQADASQFAAPTAGHHLAAAPTTRSSPWRTLSHERPWSRSRAAETAEAPGSEWESPSGAQSSSLGCDSR